MPDSTQWVPVGGWSVHLPGLCAADLPGSPAEPACPPDQARLVLGRKGLLGKEDATRLALCAVHRALGLPPGQRTGPLDYAPGTAVVVASNLGNAGTVCGVLTEMRERGSAAVSPLDAPNASSNVIASSVAIRYGFTGPNLTVCSGATAGLDAIRLGSLLLRAGRAQRAVVVGAEPADPVARELAALRQDPPGELTAGAGCVLLGQWPEPTGLWCGPVQRHSTPALMAPARTGELYGAAGVVRLAVAAARLAYGGAHGIPRGSAASFDIGCGDLDDGYASVRLVWGTAQGAAA